MAPPPARRLLDPAGRLFTSVVAKDHSTQAGAKHTDVLL
jgi:RNA polymerase II C-terminal domain phosphatase-like 3/4